MSQRKKIAQLGWPEWYADPNVGIVAGRLIKRLFKSLLLIAMIVWVVILIMAVSSGAEAVEGHTEDRYSFNDFDRVWMFGALGVVGSLASLLIATFLVVLFDQTFGKVLTPSRFAAATNGLALVPSWFAAIYILSLAGEPVNQMIAAVWFIGIVAAGAASGCWASIEQIQIVKGFPGTRIWHWFSLRQLLAAAIWLAVLFACSMGQLYPVSYVLMFVLTVTVVSIAFSR